MSIDQGGNMKRLLALVMVGVLSGSVALGQGGSIGMFTDGSGTDCNMAVTPSIVVAIHLVHMRASVPVCGVVFKTTPPECFDATFVSIQGPFPETFTGTLEDGWIANYFGPVTTPVYFGVMYFATGPGTSPCCYFTVQPHPMYGLAAWNCANGMLPATGGTLILNPNPSCTCDVPARETTWGTIKAIYRG